MANKTGNAGKWVSEGGPLEIAMKLAALWPDERRGYFYPRKTKHNPIVMAGFLRACSLFVRDLAFEAHGDLNICLLFISWSRSPSFQIFCGPFS